MALDRSTVAVPLAGRKPSTKASRLAEREAAVIARTADAELRRRAAKAPLGPQIAQPQQIGGTPSSLGRVRA